MIVRFLALSFFSLSLSLSAEAKSALSDPSPPESSRSLADQLSSLRDREVALEQDLISGAHSRKNIQKQVGKIKKLIQLQKQERELGQKRLADLQSTVEDLERRKASLSEKMKNQQNLIRKFLVVIEASGRTQVSSVNSLSDGGAQAVGEMSRFSSEKLEAPRLKVLANLVDRSLKEVKGLHSELADAARLESRIQEDQQQLAYFIQDSKEQEGILAFNHQLQMDFLKSKWKDHVAQLESYRKLKNAESQVENLIHNFNLRKEIARVTEEGDDLPASFMQGEFLKLKGKLPFPVDGGKVVRGFGRSYDVQSGLYIFKKGVEIMSDQMARPVRAISSGKVAFVGEMPHYGQVVIIDHGEHFYSLCAHLGVVSTKMSESVKEGDLVGLTGDSSTPLYFEIRARNVAVNPLQWLAN